MSRDSCASSRTTRLVLALVASTLGGLLPSLVATQAAHAQAAECGVLQKMLLQRQQITQVLAAQTKLHKKMDARFACTEFGKLVSNGNTILKWATANKDWCQIPDSFVAGVKVDHGNATSIRARACNFAAKEVQMQKQAREGGGQTGLLGGNGLQGQVKLPQGAL